MVIGRNKNEIIVIGYTFIGSSPSREESQNGVAYFFPLRNTFFVLSWKMNLSRKL